MRRWRGFLVRVWLMFLLAAPVTVPASAADCGNLTEVAGICVPTSGSTGLSDASVEDIVLTFMNWILGIFGFIAIIGFLISGFQYFFASGDEHMAETAKRNMTYSIIGVIVALSGWIIIQAIDNVLNTNPYF